MIRKKSHNSELCVYMVVGQKKGTQKLPIGRRKNEATSVFFGVFSLTQGKTPKAAAAANWPSLLQFLRQVCGRCWEAHPSKKGI